MRLSRRTAAMFALGALSATINIQSVYAQTFCASAEQATDVKAFFDQNKGLPATAALRLQMPELTIASALATDKAMGTSADLFLDTWARLTTLENAMILVLKGGHVFEMHGKIPPGTPSKRSAYFNVEAEEESEPEIGFSGHLRPDLVKTIYAFLLPGEGGIPVRSLFFYNESGGSDFGVVLAAGEDESTTENRAVFEDIWALIEQSPRSCD